MPKTEAGFNLLVITLLVAGVGLGYWAPYAIVAMGLEPLGYWVLASMGLALVVLGVTLRLLYVARDRY